MTLGADRTFPVSLSPMEAQGCDGRWRTHILELARSGAGTATDPTGSFNDAERGRTGKERDGGGPRKSVTMAPTSRYLTERQYVMRKPLFSTEQQTSILKKTHTQEHLKKQKRCTGCRSEGCREHADTDFLASPREEMASDSLDLTEGHISPNSTLRVDFTSPLGVSDLRGRLPHEEPTFSSPYLGSRSGQRSLSSPPLEVRTLTSPLSPRPRLTSTLLSPAYTPRWRHSKPQRAEFRLGGRGGTGGGGEEGGGDSHLNLSSSLGYLKGHMSPALHTMSPHQANYWACAIPKSLPPSPDRGSPGWDPDREYQALLDYTYPLRPGRVVSEWDSSELQGGSLLQIDPGLQDSGIELDRVCSSTSLSGLDLTLSGAGKAGLTREQGTLTVGHTLSDHHGLSRSSDGLLSGSPLSLTDPIGMSLESLDCGKDRRGMDRSTRNKGGGPCHQSRSFSSSSSTSTAFIRSTSVLPRRGCVRVGDWDEEYRPLPHQLEELQALSRQVREVTAKLSQPVRASWESLEPGTTSLQSSITLPEKRGAADEEEEEEQLNEQEDLIHRGDSSEAVQRLGARVGPVGRGVGQASLREVEALVEKLSGLTLPEFQRRSLEDQEHTDSLMQHIQIFCSNLEELIQWLYKVAEKMEALAPPTVDINSVKSSLAEYQSFQKEVSARQPLTSSVLQTGELLLSCMNTTSPVLRDTLGLIERQTRALETHTEHLFSSILSAMDSLTQPNTQASTQPSTQHPGQHPGQQPGQQAGQQKTGD